MVRAARFESTTEKIQPVTARPRARRAPSATPRRGVRPDLARLAIRELELHQEESRRRRVHEAERKRRRPSARLRSLHSVVAEAAELRLREEEAGSLSAAFMRLPRSVRVPLILSTYLAAAAVALAGHVLYAVG